MYIGGAGFAGGRLTLDGRSAAVGRRRRWFRFNGPPLHRPDLFQRWFGRCGCYDCFCLGRVNGRCCVRVRGRRRRRGDSRLSEQRFSRAFRHYCRGEPGGRLSEQWFRARLIGYGRDWGSGRRLRFTDGGRGRRLALNCIRQALDGRQRGRGLRLRRQGHRLYYRCSGINGRSLLHRKNGWCQAGFRRPRRRWLVGWTAGRFGLWRPGGGHGLANGRCCFCQARGGWFTGGWLGGPLHRSHCRFCGGRFNWLFKHGRFRRRVVS